MHERWTGEVRRFYTFLMSGDQCPTQNSFILGERARLAPRGGKGSGKGAGKGRGRGKGGGRGGKGGGRGGADGATAA